MEHIDIPAGEIHVPYNWSYANAAARTADVITDATLLERLALQVDTGAYYRLTGVSPAAWTVVADPTALAAALALKAPLASPTITGTMTVLHNANVGDGSANSRVAVDSIASGTAGGGAVTVQNAGTYIIAIGNYSNLIGGAYNAGAALYYSGTLTFNRGGADVGKVFSTGRWVLGTTPVDDGVNTLQVNGPAKVTGALTTTGQTLLNGGAATGSFGTVGNACGLFKSATGTSVGISVGASGGGYGEVGYNVDFQTSSNTYKYVVTDTAGSLQFAGANIFVKGAVSGSAGAALTLATWATFTSAGLNSTPVGATTPATGSFTALSSAAPATKTAATYTVLATDTSLIFNTSATHTLTLPAAASFSGRWLYLKNIAAFAINSASSNVVPQAGGAAGTGILAATAGKWAALQSDGTSWQIMMSN